MIRFPFSFLLFVFHCYPFMILIKLIFSDAFIALCGIFIKHDRRIQEKKVPKRISEVYWCSTARIQCFHRGKKKLKLQKFPVKAGKIAGKIMHFIERKIFATKILKNEIKSCIYETAWILFHEEESIPVGI